DDDERYPAGPAGDRSGAEPEAEPDPDDPRRVTKQCLEAEEPREHDDEGDGGPREAPRREHSRLDARTGTGRRARAKAKLIRSRADGFGSDHSPHDRRDVQRPSALRPTARRAGRAG